MDIFNKDFYLDFEFKWLKINIEGIDDYMVIHYHFLESYNFHYYNYKKATSIFHLTSKAVYLYTFHITILNQLSMHFAHLLVGISFIKVKPKRLNNASSMFL